MNAIFIYVGQMTEHFAEYSESARVSPELSTANILTLIVMKTRWQKNNGK